jgi:bis(5'-nucleosyl)-tetraphosphatase (symmetrical)
MRWARPNKRTLIKDADAMTDYAVGDIQGCYTPLRRLLDRVDFSPSRDRLWVAGDVVNRGPESLESLRYIASLEGAAEVVLGNHDLHLLAVVLGDHPYKGKDTIEPIVQASDGAHLIHWLRHQHLTVHDEQRNLLMSHAGLPHIWSVAEAVSYGHELEAVLRGPDAAQYFREMYGNEPAGWFPEVSGMDRLRLITNYFTRMRFIAGDGSLNLAAKESPDNAPAGFAPWFDYLRDDSTQIIFGHWAALEGHTGQARYAALDTGCVWGGSLTLMNLDTQERVSCACGDDDLQA